MNAYRDGLKDAPQPGAFPANPTLGLPVIASAVLERRGLWREASEYPKRRWAKHWVRVALARPVTGLLIGLRTVTDGDVISHGEDGNEWRVTGRHRVALVAHDLYRRPLTVPLDALVTA